MSEKDDKPLDGEAEIYELIKHALNDNIVNQKEFKKRSELKSVLKGIISEYLDSFIVIGYDFDGKEIEFEGARSAQQRDALDTLFLRYFCYKTGYRPPNHE